MKFALILLLFFSHKSFGNENLDDYLEDQEKMVATKISESDESAFRIGFHEENAISLATNTSFVKFFKLCEKPFVLLNEKLYEIDRERTSLRFSFPVIDRIAFVRTVEHGKLGIILVSTKQTTDIYGFDTNKFFRIQKMHTVDRVSDAIFFKNENDLFLVVSTHKSGHLAPTTIYKFEEPAHFNETETILTSGKTKLFNFNNNKSEIIMILQHSPKRKVFSTLYKFKSSKIKEIQKINTENWIDIISYQHKNQTYLVILGKTEEAKVYLWTGSEIIQSNELSTVDKSLYKNGLHANESAIVEEIFEEVPSRCLLNLEKAIYRIRNNIKITSNKSHDLLRTAAKTADGGLLEETESNLNEVSTKLKKLTPNLNNYLQNSMFLIINESRVFNHSLSAKNIQANRVEFKTLNNQQWAPENFLSYSKTQNISGPVKIKIIKVKKLKTNPDDTLFKDLLLSKGNQSISGNVQVNNLDVRNLTSNKINNIEMEKLYFKNKPAPIRGLKKFFSVDTKRAKMTKINSMNGSDVTVMLTNSKMLKYKFSENLKVDNLHVEKIDDLDFNSFKNSIFRIGIDEKISGNLVFSNLVTEKVSFNSQPFLTTSTDQQIEVPVFINTIFPKEIRANTINNINFDSIATFDNSTIKGPVVLQDYKVKNDLDMRGEINESILLKNNDHIVGTNESDLLQIYNKKVTLKGDLILTNLDLGKFSAISVSGKSFNPKIDTFWTKSTKQEIPVHFEALNGISTTHLQTNFINSVSVDQYMLNNKNSKSFTKYYFDDIQVNGNISLDREQPHTPDLVKINENSVKVHEGTYSVKGSRIYKNLLRIDTLETDSIEFVENNNTQSISGSKTFKKLIIKGNLITEKISTTNLNNINLRELKENALYIDEEPQITQETNFKNVEVKNLKVTNFNSANLNDIIAKINSADSVNFIKNLQIDGDVHIQKAENVTKINNFDVKTLENSSRTKFKGNVVSGVVKFLGKVQVNNFHVKNINNIDFPKFSKRILYKEGNQTITAPVTFTNLKTENLETLKINGISIKNLINVENTDLQDMFVPGGLQLAQNTEIKSISGDFNYDLRDALSNLHHPKSQSWENVVINGNVTFWDPECGLNKILENTVTNTQKHIVTGFVNFTDHICAKNIESLKRINNITISDIVNDALLIDSEEEQVVTGMKTFSQLNAEKATSSGNIQAQTVNFLNITDINSKIISRNHLGDISVLGKKKFFAGLQCKNTYVERISNTKPEDLVSFKDKKTVPHAMFETINVENNLEIELINNMPLDNLLKNRLLKNSDKQTIHSTYFFRNVEINGNMSTPAINDVKLEDVVFDEGVQTVESAKTFKNDVIFDGSLETQVINGVKLSETFEQAALMTENTEFKGKMTILSPSTVTGNIQTHFINNMPVDYMMSTVNPQSFSYEASKIYSIMQNITEFIKKNLKICKNMPNEFLYLEKSANLQISLPNTIRAEIVEGRDHVLIHIGGEEKGDYCGLDEKCKCPVQYTMQISNEHSVNVLMNKERQRIYSYYEDDIMIHFITNSFSTDAECSTSSSKVMNEMSTLTWNTYSGANRTGAFYIYEDFFKGYISDVKFFNIAGDTYVLVGTYYDPVLDTHARSCDIYKFNAEKTKMTKIQVIPGEGIWTISLLYTVKGVVLVIGEISSSRGIENAVTQIYRFNTQIDQFELLRNVSAFGSLSAVGVVLGADSFIVLANKHSYLHIMKYYQDFDTYYFYQSFDLEEPIFAMSVFYNGDFGVSEPYLSVVTKSNKYFIFSFQFIEGWKLETSGELEGLKGLIPFTLNRATYLFAPSSNVSFLLTFVKHDSD